MERLVAHERFEGCMIDTSYAKGSGGTKADYYVVSRCSGPTPAALRGRFGSLAAARAAILEVK